MIPACVMIVRVATSLAVCLAVLASSVLGLSRGMVLCIDGDGHYALESAHARHVECHQDGSDHLPEEFPTDSEHPELHAALDACFDATAGGPQVRAATPQSLRPCDAPAAPFLTVPHVGPETRLGETRAIASSSLAPLRADLARLSGIVLLV